MTDYPQVCVLTGGSSGVGLATAIKMAEFGSKVAICGRDEDRLQRAVEKLVDVTERDNIYVVQADMSEPADVKRFISESIKRFSRIDLLVNNAAMAPLAPIDEMTDETIDACIDLNIRGVYYATRAAWIQMKKQGDGIVVNISSQAAVDPFPGFSVYGSSKAWIELFTIALAGEGREHGIRSYCVRPGAIETPMLRGLFADFPAEQCVSPDDIAEMIRTVCGPEFKNSSGQIVKVSRQ